MNEANFIKFFVLLGVALLMVGNFSFLATNVYSEELVAKELLPLTLCDRTEQGGYVLVSALKEEACLHLANAEGLLETDCNVLNPPQDQACEAMKYKLGLQINSCESGDYNPLEENELVILCSVFGL